MEECRTRFSRGAIRTHHHSDAADTSTQRVVRKLSEWFVELGLEQVAIVRIEAPLFYMPDYPDDLLGSAVTHVDSLADGACVAEVFPSKNFVNHRDALR